MPQNTIPTIYAQSYLQDLLATNPNAWPVFASENGFISRWKLDDISGGSALDSQASNHLNSSGNPIQATGDYQNSGVYFDGVDDCFFIEWADGSGLHGQEVPYGSEEGSLDVQWGIQARIKLDTGALSEERVIMSKWNDIGNDKEWMWGINPSGGFFVQWKRNTGLVYTWNSSQSGLISEDDTWHSVGLQYIGRSTDKNAWAFYIDNDVVIDSVQTYRLDTLWPSTFWASGTIHIGAANYGLNPSGFFKGYMEDVRYFNRRGWTIPEWNAYASGAAPATFEPLINEANPYLIFHMPLDAIGSGHPDVSTQDQWQFFERQNQIWIPTSGTVSIYDHDHFSIQNVPSPADNSTSGLTQQTQSFASRYLTKHNRLLPDSISKHWNQGFTLGYWVKTSGVSNDAYIAGWRSSSIRAGPWTTKLSNSTISFQVQQDGDIITSFNPSTPASLEIIPLDEWVYVMQSANFADGVMIQSISGILTGPDNMLVSGIIGKNVDLDGSEFFAHFGMFRLSAAVTSYTLQGGLSEFIGFNRPLTPAQMSGFYIENSGILSLSLVSSGLQSGGYLNAIDSLKGSGILGGHVTVGVGPTNTLGGYMSGVAHPDSGMLGGYVMVGTQPTASLGGWTTGKAEWDAILGGYAKSKAIFNNLIGAYSVGSELLPVQSEFFAFFNLIGRDKKEFDAQVEIYKALTAEFDAKALVYVDEQKPGINIIDPAIPLTSGSAGITINFEAEASGLNDKSIAFTYWYFTDGPATSGSDISSSGTFTTEHTFPLSGIFDVVFVAVDNAGVVNSDRVKIDTTSGVVVPEIALTATPETGVAPLSVAFSGLVSSNPYPIIESSLSFGDGTHSASTDSIYKLYPVVGSYIPVFRVRDSRGIVVTDTTVVGVNN